MSNVGKKRSKSARQSIPKHVQFLLEDGGSVWIDPRDVEVIEEHGKITKLHLFSGKVFQVVSKPEGDKDVKKK